MSMRLKNIVMKRKFIFNSFSKKGGRGNALTEIKRYFMQRTGSFEYVAPRSRAHAIELTRQALKEGFHQIVAVGGDGTVNAVVNGFFEDGRLISPDSTLAISNLGTGSDYFRGMVEGKKVSDWKKVVLENAVRPVDVGTIHFSNTAFVDQYFSNMASVAMIAQISGKKNRSPAWIPSAFQYLLPTIRCLMSYKPQRVRLVADSNSFDLEVLTIAIAKGRYAGSGMHFGGAVSLSDGYFDVTVIESMPVLKMLTKLRKLYADSFKSEPGITKLKAKKIRITSASPLPVEYDGEVYGTTDIEISVAKHPIRLCFPQA